MPTSYQESAPGSKSAKFVQANPLDPLVRPFDHHGMNDEQEDMQRTLAENVNQRLVTAMEELKEKHRTGTNEIDAPDRAPTGQAYQMILQQQQQMQAAAAAQRRAAANQKQQQQQSSVEAFRQNQQPKKKDDDNDDDNDSDYDYLLDDDELDDDPALEALRQKRIAELQAEHNQRAENLAKGHGQYRTITQDEFLPECTGTSEWIAIHFFHKEFQRCHILDHHLKLIAMKHLKCKFLRIDAEKAPFFVSKLNVRMLPSLLVFQDGKAVDRLTGFDGLANDPKEDPDNWQTWKLEQWLGSTGAINFTTLSVEDMEQEMKQMGIRAKHTGTLYRGGIEGFEDDL